MMTGEHGRMTGERVRLMRGEHARLMKWNILE
jgi:hypothetical protein